ncbi:MAG TPA: SGNH/GDSL hydrolase family protein [Stellaceae bacterium]|nr:SGNH/GDSL hydrolase family protein [Stellaceae bacterium]
MFRAPLFALATLGLVAAVANAAVPGTAYDNIIVFGDSLSDVGNDYAATSGAEPAAPYFDGRFSNGQLWVEHVAGAYGKTLTPSLSGGTDFAFGGAETTLDRPIDSVVIPSLKTQSISYLVSAGGRSDPNALYVIWGGGNDVFCSIPVTTVCSANGTASPSALPAKFAARTFGIIERLKVTGARSFLVVGVPDVGLTPAAIASGQSAAATTLARQLNVSLVATLADPGLNSGATIAFVNVFKVMDAIIGGTTHFAFTDVADPCYGGSGTSFCADPDHTFFWDAIHPTSFGHAMIGVEAMKPLPLK